MMYQCLKSLHLIVMLLFSGGLMALALVISGWEKVGGFVLPHETSIGRILLRWDRFVTVPAMLGTWVIGASIASMGGWMGQAWLFGKITMVVILSGLHGVMTGALRKRISGTADTSRSWHHFAPLLVALGLAFIVVMLNARYW
jgi:protoporphyrinogen IX oxidase